MRKFDNLSKNSPKKIIRKGRNKRNRYKKNKREILEKTQEKLEIEFKNREGNRQPIYEMNINEIYRIKENSIHLKNYYRKFIANRCNGIWETEYEIDYVGKNIKRQFFKQKSKSNKNRFHIDKVKKQFIAITTEINVVMKEDPNIHIFQNRETGIALLLLATYCSEEKEEIIINETCIEIF